MKASYLSLEVAFSMIGRAVNTGLPSVYEGQLSAKEMQTSRSQEIIVKADNHSQILTCAQIAWDELSPPKEWKVDISPTLVNELSPQTRKQLGKSYVLIASSSRVKPKGTTPCLHDVDFHTLI